MNIILDSAENSNNFLYLGTTTGIPSTAEGNLNKDSVTDQTNIASDNVSASLSNSSNQGGLFMLIHLILILFLSFVIKIIKFIQY